MFIIIPLKSLTQPSPRGEGVKLPALRDEKGGKFNLDEK